MEKLVFSVCFLTVCFLISDSSCLDMFKSRSAKKFSLFKSRQSFNNFKKRSFSGDNLNVRGKPEGKGQDPPQPPPVQDVWGTLGISREDFMKKHKDNLTAEVRSDIKENMMEDLQDIKAGMEYWARVISCSSLDGMYDNGATAKRTVNDTESQVERNITEVEQQEENALEALLATFGVNETNLGPLIIGTGNEKADDDQTLAICGRLLMVKTIKKLAENSENTLVSFMNSFEEYLKGTLTFFRMYYVYLSTEVPDDSSMDEVTRVLQANKLNELKRFLQDAIAELTFKK
ncbi:uncharacterized protein [Magallana gigas]|uniref:uncharacterized protein isoform X2 n=1 Tax=Magallana gigas TaxID=29159 RepID=UPI00333EF860